MKKALITGVTGQDGSYLAEFLLEKGYQVHGIARRLPSSHLSNQLTIYQADLADSWRLKQLVEKIEPDEIYNLGAMSNERQSYEMAEYTINIDGIGTLRLLEAMRGCCPKARLFQAATSELFGKTSFLVQNEKTPFHPRSPYGVAKLFAYWSVINYREAYGLYACNGILFNHESPRRGELFVTRKIAKGVVLVKRGVQEKIVLGNLDMQRDWGFALDYVKGMWLMLQQNKAEDYILATGKLTTVRRFVEIAFEAVGVALVWKGHGLDEKGYDAKAGKVCVEISPEFYRPLEEVPLQGDATKAQKELNWTAETSLEKLIHLMVEHEVHENNLH